MADDQTHDQDQARRRRLRWRARRGLLENDLVLTRFLDRHEASLSERQIQGLDELLDLTDNDLLDLILARRDANPGEISTDGMALLQQLRSV